MKILSIAMKDLLITLKDKKALALIILMPIVLIMVLGFSLSSMFKQGSVSIKRFDAAIVDKDGGELAANFKEFLNSEEIKKMVSLKEMDEKEAMDRVRKGDIPALIIIPEGYTESVNSGKEASIMIYKDPGSPMRSQIIESLIKSYTGAVSAVQGSVEAAGEVFKDYKMDPRMILPEVLKTVEDNGNVEFNESNLEEKKGVSAMQYYAAAMLVMYILFVGMLGTTSIIEERDHETLMGLMSAAVPNRAILAGKILGLFLLGVFDVSALIAFTRIVFNVDWGSSVLALLLLSAAMIFAASGLAVFIATLFKTSKAVDSVNPVIVMVMSFLGGSMFPIFSMPPVLQSVSRITLNNWALRGYLNLMLGNGINSVITPCLVLSAMGAALLLAGILRLRLE